MVLHVESDGWRAARWIGRNLRELRDERNISLTVLAELMTARGHRWSQQKGTKVETGKQGVSLAEVIDLAVVLRTTVPRLIRPERSGVAKRVIALTERVVTGHAQAVSGTLAFQDARAELLEALAAAEALEGTEGADDDLADVIAEGREAASRRLKWEV